VTFERPIAGELSRPRFPAHVRMQFDPVRQRVAVLAPERVYWPDDIAKAILDLCDGERTIGVIAARLASEFAAPAETIRNDVLEFVQSWLDIRLLRL
jgi:pyrroloquinoline quinone biosynthesis protein D